jgi:predicted site-specific integrase-resolvase
MNGIQMEGIVSQQKAADLTGVSVKTIQRWEEKGLIKRFESPRPGTWYTLDSIARLGNSADDVLKDRAEAKGTLKTR